MGNTITKEMIMMKRYLYEKFAKPGILTILTIGMLSSAMLVQAATVKSVKHSNHKATQTQHIKH